MTAEVVELGLQIRANVAAGEAMWMSHMVEDELARLSPDFVGVLIHPEVGDHLAWSVDFGDRDN